MIVAAVTGTNGKSSVVTFARQIWTRLGHEAGSIGTLGVVAPGMELESNLTTPFPPQLRNCLQMLAERGVDRVALEASSIGLAEHRLDGVRISIGAFTNLTRDHLGYHGDMKAYFRDKLRLFREVMPPGGTAVLNADVPEIDALRAACATRRHSVLTFGAHAEHLRLECAGHAGDCQSLRLSLLGRTHDVRFPLLGTFQAQNALCALGIVLASGAEARSAVAALETLRHVPGRLELVARRSNGAVIYVDFAHSPDALTKVLEALRPLTTGRLRLVFGCGGGYDPGKRPLMGRVARELADDVIVTDTNPRHENPALIRREALAGCPEAREIGDRKEAIHTAVAELEEGDVLVVTGKGHERLQYVGDRTVPFDDHHVVRVAVQEAERGGRRRG